jgi:hypothetical protein
VDTTHATAAAAVCGNVPHYASRDSAKRKVDSVAATVAAAALAVLALPSVVTAADDTTAKPKMKKPKLNPKMKPQPKLASKLASKPESKPESKTKPRGADDRATTNAKGKAVAIGNGGRKSDPKAEEETWGETEGRGNMQAAVAAAAAGATGLNRRLLDPKS